MTDDEKIRATQDAWDLLMMHAKLIAMLPIETWLEAFDKAEVWGPVVDPTMFRDYLYSGKGEIIKSIMRAALPLKKAVLDAQPALAKMMGAGKI